MWAESPLVKKNKDRVYISVVFSWDSLEALRLARYYDDLGKDVSVGGPAVRYNPDWFGSFGSRADYPMLHYYNPDATFTSRGCLRSCSFCAVPRIEGKLIELTDWEAKPVVCDNNLLACSVDHFETVIEKLKPLKGIDFNQGLDARLLTQYHAEKIAELDMKVVRISWDHIKDEAAIMSAWERLRGVGIPKSKITIFILIGFNDTPEGARYRLETVKSLGSMPFPMRYQPLDARKKNSRIGKHWENWLLNAYMRYWARLRFTRAVPFDEWLDTYRHRGQKEKQETISWEPETPIDSTPEGNRE